MILIFGPMGAGKSVQGQIIAARHGWRWISAGQLLRSTYDPQILGVMKTGELANPETVNGLVLEYLKRSKDIDHVVMDGFPRTLEQVKWLVELEPQHERAIQLVIILDVPAEEVLRRLSLRGRLDDTPEAISRRTSIYNENIGPIIDYLKLEKIRVAHVDGNAPVDEVSRRIEAELKVCSLV